jgi:hypothetical protein
MKLNFETTMGNKSQGHANANANAKWKIENGKLGDYVENDISASLNYLPHWVA